MIAKGSVPDEVVAKPCSIKIEVTGENLHEYSGVKNTKLLSENHSPCHEYGHQCDDISSKPKCSVEKNYAQADPSYLGTLGQTQSSWIFGAIAELVDNSRDAKATKYVNFLALLHRCLFSLFFNIFSLFYLIVGN